MVLFLGLGLKAMNTALTVCNWQLGERIAREHLGEDAREKALKLVKIGHYLSFLFYLCTFNDS